MKAMKIQKRRTPRILSLPVWLKLRMDDELKNQVMWMIDGAEKYNACSVSQSVVLKHRNRPWKVTLQVMRVYDNKH